MQGQQNAGPESVTALHQDYEGCFDPSVAQPPLPLQLFLPLQPLSLLLQPPWPLQSFLPLQECLLVSWWSEALPNDALPDLSTGFVE